MFIFSIIYPIFIDIIQNDKEKKKKKLNIKLPFKKINNFNIYLIKYKYFIFL